jgi:hypothetical protein
VSVVGDVFWLLCCWVVSLFVDKSVELRFADDEIERRDDGEGEMDGIYTFGLRCCPYNSKKALLSRAFLYVRSVRIQDAY